MSVDLASVDDVPARGVAAVARERLESANLSAEIAGLRSIAFDGIETAVVAIPMTAPTSTLRRVAEALAGLAHQCVLVDQPAVRASDERTAVKDGRTWRIGTQSDVAWIQDDTLAGMSINAALPPVFEAYATVVIPDEDADRQAGDSALLQLLAEQTATQPWWLGYLDTGVHDTVFDRVWKVMLYAGWSYVLVEAGPTEAGTWRAGRPLARTTARPRVPRRPLVAGVDALGRRLAMPRWPRRADPGGDGAPGPGLERRAHRRGRHASRPRRTLTAAISGTGHPGVTSYLASRCHL